MFSDPVHAELYEWAWERMEYGRTHRKHPFHTPTVSTLSADGPEARTVVLRRVYPETREVGFQCDIRSDKAQQVLADPRVSLTFYGLEDKLQIRLWTRATLHTMDDLTRDAWNKVPLLSRRCYLIHPHPGVETAEFMTGIPLELQDREPTEEESEPGYANLAVIMCKVIKMDVLSLVYTGHRRVQYTFDPTGEHEPRSSFVIA